MSFLMNLGIFLLLFVILGIIIIQKLGKITNKYSFLLTRLLQNYPNNLQNLWPITWQNMNELQKI